MDCAAFVLVLRIVDPAGQIQAQNIQCGMPQMVCEARAMQEDGYTYPNGFHIIATCEEKEPPLVLERDT